MEAKHSTIVLLAANLLFLLLPSLGVAQSQIDQPQSDRRDANLLRQGNITSAGATVPLPGASKSAGQTSLDAEIERHDDRISRTICSNC